MKLDTFINRPVLSTVISIFIVLLGLIGLSSLPVTQYPDIAPPTISVTTSYNGANAQAVLNSVIAPLEGVDQRRRGHDLHRIHGHQYRLGHHQRALAQQGFDPDMAAVDVQNRVSKGVNLLPSEVTQVGVLTQKRQSSMLGGLSDRGSWTPTRPTARRRIPRQLHEDQCDPRAAACAGCGRRDVVRRRLLDAYMDQARGDGPVWADPRRRGRRAARPERGGRPRLVRRPGQPVVPVYAEIPRPLRAARGV